MSAHLSIKNKVQAVAWIGVIGFALYFFLSVRSNLEYQDLLAEISSDDLQVMALTNNINLSLNQIESITQTVHGDSDIERARELAVGIEENFRRLIAKDRRHKDDLEILRNLNELYIGTLIDIADGTLSPEEAEGKQFMLNVMSQDIEKLGEEYRVNRFNAVQDKIEKSKRISRESNTFGLIVGFLLTLPMLFLARYFANGVTQTLSYVSSIAGKISKGDWHVEIKSNTQDETAEVLSSMERMRDSLREQAEEDNQREERQNRLMTLSDISRGDLSSLELCQNIMRKLPQMMDAQVGAFYLMKEEDEEQYLQLIASYAFVFRKGLSDKFRIGEGIVGQVAIEKSQVVLSELPEDYLSISSSLGASSPGFVVVTPLIFDDHLFGVFELGFIKEPKKDEIEFLAEAGEVIAQFIETSSAREKVREMLEKTREQAEKLEHQQEILQSANEDLENQAMALTESESRLLAQQEELRVSNEELEEQAKALKLSEERLQAQQEELRVTNEELEEHTRALEQQKADMKIKNEELEKSRQVLEEKTKALELSGQYKSEFMSTMSHELRTPLNSILILSENLSENDGNNLTDKQVEHAKVINKAGGDLLELINDILDLAKVEEGKLDLILDEITFKDWAKEMEQLFSPVSEKKGISFSVDLADDLPEKFESDEKRLNQILKNMLSNALKFTERGSVTLSVATAPDDLKLNSTKYKPEDLFAFSVTDTGLGIDPEKQNMIFEAFQQSDGAISRKYGGTGLGLTISTRLAHLLGGEISVFSEGLGEGSTFTLYVPKEAPDDMFDMEASESLLGKEEPSIVIESELKDEAPDQKEETPSLPKSNTLLIVEDDPEFAKALVELSQDYGLEVQLAPDGETALELVKVQSFKGIILDLVLPGVGGMEVLEEIKEDPRLEGVPIHVMSGKEGKDEAISKGAIDFLQKPASKKQISKLFESFQSENLKRLLLIEKKDSESLGTVKNMFQEQGLKLECTSTVNKAVKILADNRPDCIIFDLDVLSKSADPVEALVKLHDAMGENSIPLIVYTGNEVDREQEAQLRKYSDRVILKTNASEERLMNEASLFLHWLGEDIGQSDTKTLARDELFEGKRVLIVDDDMRNVYSLTAELERRGMVVEAADSGIECLEVLQSESSTFDMVLMDIMMPELDGFSTIEQIRSDQRFQELPIIVLTAKSLKEDRLRCMELGANDYLLKPIDMERLMALMRVWMT